MWHLTKEQLQQSRDERQYIREEEQFLFLDVLSDTDGYAQSRVLRRRASREQSRAGWAAHAQQLEMRNARR